MSHLVIKKITKHLETLQVFGRTDMPFRLHLTPGDPRIVVIAGANASGKSLAFKALAQHVRAREMLPVHLSMRGRCGGGMASVMYGIGEDISSTGASSFGTVEGGFRNVNRDEIVSVLMLDEPDIGLSDGYSGAMGEYIGRKLAELTPRCAGVVLITHSRSLLRRLVAATGQTPTFVHTFRTDTPNAECRLTFDQWMGATEHRTVEELEHLSATQLSGQRAVWKLEKEHKAAKEREAKKVSKPKRKKS